MGHALPVITWLIRSDETVRFCTGSYSSGFTSRQKLWRSLANQGHELGWHMHNLSFDWSRGRFSFDPNPYWLSAAHDSLTEHYPVRATRVGWDYGSTELFNTLDRIGIRIDFSALPWAYAPLIFLGSIAAAIVTYLMFERPITRALQRRIARNGA